MAERSRQEDLPRIGISVKLATEYYLEEEALTNWSEGFVKRARSILLLKTKPITRAQLDQAEGRSDVLESWLGESLVWKTDPVTIYSKFLPMNQGVQMELQGFAAGTKGKEPDHIDLKFIDQTGKKRLLFSIAKYNAKNWADVHMNEEQRNDADQILEIIDTALTIRPLRQRIDPSTHQA